eukprot:TRINITY_DN11063_c0_g1_i3.p1 TRINITY_DN11063_c0_g1~~TRINITY_DN11063_c0_g1_i3.p1  ORF type:complete len:556 (+),score=59.45 TRINITY_DN11063_c0_g1_i3:1443-3110(+)
MVLPFKLREWKWKTKARLKHEDVKFEIKAVIGRYKLQHSTVKETLQFLQKEKNPDFLFEIRGANKQPVAMVVVKPSDLLYSLENFGAVISVDQPADESTFKYHLTSFGRRDSATVFSWARWLVFPSLFTMSNWYMLRNPLAFVGSFPDIFSRMQTSVKDVLPIHPTDMMSAWTYGRLSAAAEAATDPDVIQKILDEAAQLAGRKVSLDELTVQLPKIITELDSPHGIISRTYGLFSLINIFWLFSIAGISVSIGPAVWALLAPIRRILKKIILISWRRVIKPTLEKLHSWGVFEAALWAGCLAITSDGWKQHSSHTDAGKLISLSGIALACLPGFGYSTLLNGLKLLNTIDSDTRVQLYATYIAATLTPLAIHRNSTLVGYFVVSALYVGLGLSGSAGNLCWCIGFKRKDALEITNALSALSVSSFAAMHIMGVNTRYLSPFRSAALVMGSITHFISALIIANKFFQRRRDYWKNQLRMIVPLLCSLTVSYVGNIPGLANTSTVFGSLYAVEKYIELHDELKWDGWVLVLLLSGLTYKTSLLAHQNPEFIAAIFA